MTDIHAEEHPAETTPGGGDAEVGATGEPPGAPDAAPGGDPAGSAGDIRSDESASQGGAGEASGQAVEDPGERLQGLQDEIDAVRRRAEEDGVDQGEERFIQEGEASEDQPVDDTIAPPG